MSEKEAGDDELKKSDNGIANSNVEPIFDAKKELLDADPDAVKATEAQNFEDSETAEDLDGMTGGMSRRLSRSNTVQVKKKENEVDGDG